MGNFIDRTGEINYNNQGEKMTIIAYRKAIDIDIQFEDGSIAYNTILPLQICEIKIILS